MREPSKEATKLAIKGNVVGIERSNQCKERCVSHKKRGGSRSRLRAGQSACMFSERSDTPELRPGHDSPGRSVVENEGWHRAQGRVIQLKKSKHVHCNNKHKYGSFSFPLPFLLHRIVRCTENSAEAPSRTINIVIFPGEKTHPTSLLASLCPDDNYIHTVRTATCHSLALLS